MYYGRVKNCFNENPKATFPNLFSAEHWCSARSEGVLVTNSEKPRIREYFIKFEFSYLVLLVDSVHVRIFMGNFHLVTDRSRCADFCLINEGPQSICVPYICSKLIVFRDQTNLGSADLRVLLVFNNVCVCVWLDRCACAETNTKWQ